MCVCVLLLVQEGRRGTPFCVLPLWWKLLSRRYGTRDSAWICWGCFVGPELILKFFFFFFFLFTYFSLRDPMRRQSCVCCLGLIASYFVFNNRLWVLHVSSHYQLILVYLSIYIIITSIPGRLSKIFSWFIPVTFNVLQLTLVSFGIVFSISFSVSLGFVSYHWVGISSTQMSILCQFCPKCGVT